METTTTGQAPLAIADMRAVIDVLNATQNWKLHYVERRSLTEFASDLASPGPPAWFYFEDQTIKTWPVGEDVLSVRYLRAPAELANDSDPPLVPARFQDLIIDGAVQKGYRDRDNFEAASALRDGYEKDLFVMAQSLLVRNHSQPDYVVQTAEDYA